MKVYIEIRKNIVPKDRWHWVVIFENGHTWEISKSHPDVGSAAREAATLGVDSVLRAEKAVRVLGKTKVA